MATSDLRRSLPPRRCHSGRELKPIPLAELTPRELGAWRELAQRAIEPNPFFEPECVLPAARYLGTREAAVLVIEDAARDWLACMPVAHRLRVGGRTPWLCTWRHPYAFLGTPLVAAGAVEAATSRMLDALLGARRLGVVVLAQLGADGPVARGLLAALASRGREPVLHRCAERAVIRRRCLTDGVDGVISSRHRRDLRRLARRLGEKLGAPLEVRDYADSSGAIERFMELEASGWKGHRGTAILSYASHAAFFRALCAGFGEMGRLQLLGLGTEDRTVSYKCNLLAGDAVFCFKIAFDESLAEYRPGVQLELRMLERFRDQMGQTWMDSCSDPSNGLFKRLWPERRQVAWYVLADSSAVSTLRAWTSPYPRFAPQRR